MNLIADRVVEPPRHVASDEFDGRHAADLVPIGLPEWTMKWPAGFVASGFHRFGDLHLLEVGDRQATFVHEHGPPRIAIDGTTEVWTRARHAIGVPPEITQFCPLAPDDKQRGSSTEGQP